MTGTLIGADQAELDARRRELEGWASVPDADTGLVGTVEQVAARLKDYEAVGVSRVYLQWMLHRDIDAVELIGRELVPAVA
jgi:alkanesulfonate monooxygenase SsuD/methylene tetrahydromethanopterin reductase-like flavin-dependent oxidoreductase (luciferase family)